jgi:hypothetical protein
MKYKVLFSNAGHTIKINERITEGIDCRDGRPNNLTASTEITLNETSVIKILCI